MSDQPITFDIDDPADAHAYVKTWGPRFFGKVMDHVATNLRRIDFATMSDEDACWIAQQFWLLELELEQAKS